MARRRDLPHLLTLMSSCAGQAARGAIHLLATEVVMPDERPRAAGAARRHLAWLRVLFMSCHTADVIAHHGVLENAVSFLQKPFTGVDLAAKVRAALDQQSRFWLRCGG
ncbi:MAG: hypothetical protein HY901_26460 [Deltaproteobacteria bacterium]|nr:hypothetical protein [Deltaproteobacteria bacterium]